MMLQSYWNIGVNVILLFHVSLFSMNSIEIDIFEYYFEADGSERRTKKARRTLFGCWRENAMLFFWFVALWQTLQWHFWIYNNNNNARSKAYCKLIPDVNPFSSHWFHVTVSFWLLWFGFVLYFPLCLSCYVYLIDYNALLFPRKMQIALKISNWGKNQHTQQKIYEINQ